MHNEIKKKKTMFSYYSRKIGRHTWKHGSPRVAAARVPQDVEMAELIANLQARLDAQQQENQVIRQ